MSSAITGGDSCKEENFTRPVVILQQFSTKLVTITQKTEPHSLTWLELRSITVQTNI